MELKLQIGYRELLSLIRQLPASRITQSKTKLSDTFIAETAKTERSQL